MTQPGQDADLARSLARSWYIARITDDLVRIPGTRFGLGLDALIGLVPGIGDAAGTVLSGFILTEAVRQRVPIHVLLRMAWHLLVDAALGFLPGVGDVADAAHRANRKNARLLESTLAAGHRADPNDRTYVLRAVLVVVVILAVLVAVSLVMLWLLIKGIRAAIG